MSQLTEFQRRAAPLADDLLNALEQEHIREVEVLYRDQLMYRAELQRVIGVMQQDMLPREKKLHDMLEQLNNAYAAATKHLHEKVGAMASSGDSSRMIDSKKQLIDPLQDMERELSRISGILSKPIARVKDLTPEQMRSIEQTVARQGFSPKTGSPSSRLFDPSPVRQPMPAMTKVYYTQPRSPSEYGSPLGYAASPPMGTWPMYSPGIPGARPGTICYASPYSGSAQVRASSAGALSPNWGTPTSQPRSPMSPDVSAKIFDVLDKNHDGVLTREEFKSGMRKLL